MMFDEETVNAFSGGYRVSESGVNTLFGLPAVSNLKKIIAIPVSLSMSALVKKGGAVAWRGGNTVELPFEMSKLSNDWYDPIKLMTNIAIQRGWMNAPTILVEENLKYQLSLGYYSAFVDLLVQSFSLVNDITLSTSEFMQISGEIQDRIQGHHYEHETIARKQGKEGNLLFYDASSKSFKNETVSFEPFSMFLISENSLSPNQNFLNFRKSFKKFNDGNMMNRDPSSLGYPFVGIRNHLSVEEETYGRAMESFYSNDMESFVSIISQFSQSLGYNLGVLSDFQRTMAKLLEKYSVKTFIFNVSEHSGSLLVFADSQELSKIKDNAIRDYYNLVNRTIKFDELQISNGSTTESIRS
jgi:hypothetical protein